MSEPPEGIDERNLEGSGRVGTALRQVTVGVLAAILVTALTGVFGQPGRTRAADAPAARLTMETASVVRGGLFFQAHIEVVARQEIEYPRLVLDEGWLDGLQINTIEPAPESESSRDGRLVLSYSAMKPGDRLLVSIHLQTEPTRVGITTDNGVELDDASTPIATIEHRIRRMP